MKTRQNDDDLNTDFLFAQLQHYEALHELTTEEQEKVANLSFFIYHQFKGTVTDRKILVAVLRALFNLGYEAGHAQKKETA